VDDQVKYYCANGLKCKAQCVAYFSYIVHKTILNIKGLDYTTLDKLFDIGITNIQQLMDKQLMRTKLTELNVAESIIDSIIEHILITTSNLNTQEGRIAWFTASGIPKISKESSLKLFKDTGLTITKVLDLAAQHPEQLLEYGLSKIQIRSIISYLGTNRNKPWVDLIESMEQHEQ
jgi:NAD-dependent DNA ligase